MKVGLCLQLLILQAKLTQNCDSPVTRTPTFNSLQKDRSWLILGLFNDDV